MGVTLANYDKALKDFYLDPAREQLNHAVMTLAMIERSSEQVEGRNAVLSLHLGRNSGVGARPELGVLPTAGQQAFVEERTALKYNYATIELSKQSMTLAKTDRGSFVRPVEREMEGAMQDLRREVNRQVFNDAGQNIAQCGVTSAANVVVLATTTNEAQMRFFEVGMVVDIGTSASTTAIATARTITAVNIAGKTITINGAAVTTTASHFVYRSGIAAVGNEITGLRQIVNNTGALFGVDPSTQPIWASEVYANGGTNRTFADTLIEQAVDTADTISGEWPDIIICSKGARRNFVNQQKANKRYDGSVNTVRAGYKGIPIDVGDNGELTMFTDRDCPNNRAFGLNTKRMCQREASDWDWEDLDGSILTRAANGTHAFNAILYKFHELVTEKRATHFRIDDLSES